MENIVDVRTSNLTNTIFIIFERYHYDSNSGIGGYEEYSVCADRLTDEEALKGLREKIELLKEEVSKKDKLISELEKICM